MKKNITLIIIVTSITTATLTASLMHVLNESAQEHAERKAVELARGYLNGDHDTPPTKAEQALLPGHLQDGLRRLAIDTRPSSSYPTLSVHPPRPYEGHRW